MGVLLALFIVSFSMPAAASEDYFMGSGMKFTRGIVNGVTGWLDFPKQIFLTSRDDNPFTGFTYGAAKGVAFSVLRSAAGVYETGFFFVPAPSNFYPVMEPEFIWDGF